MKLPEHFFEEIINFAPYGIIIMDKDRTIYYMNESAKSMCGWKIGDSVPYCSYCQQREIEEGENRCILAVEDPVPFFYSHMAVYSGIEEEFEMSLKKMNINNEDYYILQLRRPVENEISKKAKFNELLVQETMLAQEAERRKIARELHDHIGQSVYSIFLGLEGIKPYVNNKTYESHLTKMITGMEKTLNDIKCLSKNLRSETVDHLGLKDALYEAVRDWEELYKVDIQFIMDTKINDCFEREKELHFFRIIQEGVNNAVRHGNATSISIHIKSSNQFIYFYIHDNGIGFDVKTKKSNGLGLKHMYERSKMLGGAIKWSSKKGGPTKVEGFVSINKNEGDNEYESADC